VALIEHLDDGIGRVLQALDHYGLRQNTMVILTSDNGGQLSAGVNNGDLQGGKGNMYEGGLRVPMVVTWPGRIKPGGVSDRMGLTMDLFATICEAAGISLDYEIDGMSLLPIMFDGSRSLPLRYVFWIRREGGVYGGKDYHAVRYGPWKLLQNTPFEPMQLFNLLEDPFEEKPSSTEHPMYDKLFSTLRDHINKSGAIPWNN
jgi:arylsulfatase A-like enzyme